jgi:hypothetical protein
MPASTPPASLQAVGEPGLAGIPGTARPFLVPSLTQPRAESEALLAEPFGLQAPGYSPPSREREAGGSIGPVDFRRSLFPGQGRTAG